MLVIKLAVFFSAALLFVIQPLITKYLLPFFGGSHTIWTISVFFFTSTLLVGYVYAGLLVTWSRNIVLAVHGGLWLFTTGLLWWRFQTDSSALLVGFVEQGGPGLSVLLSLVVLIGLPTFLLASTSVLAQAVYARASGTNPYPLYALSNAGSLIGLGVYPFFLEPAVGLSIQSNWWLWGFSLLCGAMLILLMQYQPQSASVEQGGEHGVPLRPFMIIGLAALPTMLMTALTENLSKGISSFPLLWVIPLIAYLLSFIVAFRGEGRVVSVWLQATTTLLALGTLFILSLGGSGTGVYWLYFLVSTIALFFVATATHRWLYAIRPEARRLGLFYVYLTLGGALGSGIVGFVFPALLNSTIELPFILAVATGLFAYSLRPVLAPYLSPAQGNVVIAGFLIGIATFPLVYAYQSSQAIQARNFYGGISVADRTHVFGSSTIEARYILNGSIVHGIQELGQSGTPSAASYYGPGSGIDEAIRRFADDGEQSALPRIMVIGLGAGMINAYCADASLIEYVEINPLVYDMALAHFTYLDICPEKTEVHIADGRRWLDERTTSEAPYDVIMMDAFTDNAIPTHLLTQEAFLEAYLPHLSEDGVIAIHVSNRYLYLPPVVSATAESVGLESRLLTLERSEDNKHPLHHSTTWVMVGRPGSLGFLDELDTVETSPASSLVWTDDKNSVLPTIR